VFVAIVWRYRATRFSAPKQWIHDRFLCANIQNISFPYHSKPGIKISLLQKDVSSSMFDLLPFTQLALRPLCTGSCGYDLKEIDLPKSFTHHRDCLFNRNLTNTIETHLQDWITLQIKYVCTTLTWKKKLVLLTYTYGGDQMLNQLLLGNVDVQSILPETNVTKDSLYSRYRDRYVMPLVSFLYQDLQQSSSWDGFATRVMHTTDISKPMLSTFKTLYRHKGKPLGEISTYILLFRFLIHSRDRLPVPVFQTWLGGYAYLLNDIILDAPRPSFSFYVYRGIKTNDYVRIGHVKKHLFVQKSFLSTSLNLCEAFSFKNKETPCCMHQIFVHKQPPCLLMGLTYFPEAEVLFPLTRSLYPLRPEYTAKNVNVRVQDFALV